MRTVYAQGLSDVPKAAWDRLVPASEPFMRHDFLVALERTDCVGTPASGWVPHHVLAYVDGALVGAMPLYVKFDSYGEYIFDWAWAEAALAAGIPYYPKLVAAVPFTPVTGRRLLLDAATSAAERAGIAQALVAAALALADALGASSVHALFCREDELAPLRAAGFFPRLSQQYHWHRRPHWHTFDAFLADLRAPNRKQIRRERQRAQGHGLSLSMAPAGARSDADWRAMIDFYRQTVDDKGAMAYLNGAFFGQLRARMPDTVWTAMAHAGAEPVAGALYLRCGNHLYGRYWGCRGTYDALHFELCYYLPIAWGLAHGIDRFEAGAQGDHKLKRGLLPAACHSAHWLRHPRLAAAVGRFVAAEAEAARGHMAALARHGPYRRDDDIETGANGADTVASDTPP